MFDLVVIGGGIVGLSCAWNYQQQQPDASVLVVEKETTVGLHQSGRNSGVLHSGIYYKPGTLRASLCRVGKQPMEQFCEREGIAYDLCGKVIVAKDASELAGLKRIYKRGITNSVQCELIGRERLLEIEPHVNGIQAIHVPEAGIADYPAVARRLAELINENGGQVICGTRALGVREQLASVIVQTTAGDFEATRVISCAGLHADRVARMTPSAETNVEILPFRGEYFQLTSSAEHLCNGLIYPVPDPRFPFLGVHFTKMIEGGVDCGPNAVLAFAREGYNKTDFNGRDLWDALRYRGFQKLAVKYWRKGLHEMWRSANKRAFVKALQKLIPAVTADDLVHHPAGVRAMAISADGEICDDFAFVSAERVLHVINAPSPAATASLKIGEHIISQLE